jgi:CRP-like cAMP-binding protein
MLTGAPRAATVAAVSEVECFRLDRDAFDELLRSRPEIAEDVAEVLASRQEDLARSREALEQGGERLSRADRQVEILGRMKHFFGLS